MRINPQGEHKIQQLCCVKTTTDKQRLRARLHYKNVLKVFPLRFLRTDNHAVKMVPFSQIFKND